MTSYRSLALILPLLALALTAGAQETTPPPAEPGTSIPYDLEVGFRTLHVGGSKDMYRTQINERSGLLLRSFTLLTPDLGGDTSRFFDRFRVDASDLGAGPAGSLRIEADKSELYRFRLAYRHSDDFSALPAFANPLLANGVIPGQHTYDRTRNLFDADLDLLPGRNITPFVGFSVHRASGPGTTTYTLGGDDFRLSQDLVESEQEIRVGSGFNVGWLSGSMTQGWRRTRESESLTLDTPDGGNDGGSLLGQPVVATALTREDRTRSSTPFTSLYLTGQPWSRVRLIGDYTRFAADSSGDLDESAAGSFVSFALSRYFNGLTDSAASSAKNTTWRGGGRVEVTVDDGIVAFAGYRKEHRDLEGSALINTLYLQTLTFGGVDPRDVQTILNANSSIDRDEKVANVGASVRLFGPLALRFEYSETRQDVTVDPDLSEIVVPGAQSGDFQRRVRTLDTNGSFTKAGVTLAAAYRRDWADQPIFRTDFRNRERLRLRAAWQASKWIRAGVTAENTKQGNDQPGIDLDGRARQYSGDVEVTPHEGIGVHASLSRFRSDNSILIRRPENFDVEPSLYAEDGRSREGGITVSHAPFSFDASAARFLNSGANPFEIHRFRLRVGYDLPARTRTGLVAEYASDKYDEASAGYADFNASRFGLFVRYRP